jgi:hypothetical protein
VKLLLVKHWKDYRNYNRTIGGEIRFILGRFIDRSSIFDSLWVNASQGKQVLLKFKFGNGSNPRWVNPVMSWPTMNRTKCQYWWLYQQVLQSFLFLFWFYVEIIVSLRIFKEYHIYNWLLNIKKLSSAYDFRWYYHTSEFFKIISTVVGDFSSGINYISPKGD